MTATHRAATCRFAAPTLTLKHPDWLDAHARPWSCVRDATPAPLETTEVCRTCTHWEPDRAVRLTPARP
ncbi:MAG: hypothetical protein R2752_22610 [Vicinamibacterales bacterium]